MNVQSKVRMPSPLLRSFTRRMTRNRRKKVMEMRALSSVFCGAKSRGSEVERDEGTEVAESVWLRFTGGWGPNRDPGSRHV